MGTFRNVVAWQRSVDLVGRIYTIVATFPKSELYCLSLQMRRSAVSIPSNLAEGCGRYTAAEERQFVRHARGSNYELQTQIELATRLGFIEPETSADLMKDAQEVGRLINGYLRTVDRRATPMANG